jgi:hypothetical protein
LIGTAPEKVANNNAGNEKQTPILAGDGRFAESSIAEAE